MIRAYGFGLVVGLPPGQGRKVAREEWPAKQPTYCNNVFQETELRKEVILQHVSPRCHSLFPGCLYQQVLVYLLQLGEAVGPKMGFSGSHSIRELT